jgi:hypothetical protein
MAENESTYLERVVPIMLKIRVRILPKLSHESTQYIQVRTQAPPGTSPKIYMAVACAPIRLNGAPNPATSQRDPA